MRNTEVLGQKGPVLSKHKNQSGVSRNLFYSSSFYELRWKEPYFSPKDVTVCAYLSISLYLSANNFWPH